MAGDEERLGALDNARNDGLVPVDELSLQLLLVRCPLLGSLVTETRHNALQRDQLVHKDGTRLRFAEAVGIAGCRRSSSSTRKRKLKHIGARQEPHEHDEVRAQALAGDEWEERHGVCSRICFCTHCCYRC